jgi:hypothetical protein
VARVIWRWAISIWRTLVPKGSGSSRVEAAPLPAESRTWEIVEDEERAPPTPAEIEQIIDIDPQGHRLGETWTCRIRAGTEPADFALLTVRPLAPTKS